MPIFMDRHDDIDVAPEELAAAHGHDVELQGEYGVNCFTYWFDQDRRSVFCLMEAPDADAVKDLHRASHGLVPNHIIEVDPNMVGAFLGRIADPENTGEYPVRESAFRAIMFTDMANSTDITNTLGDDAAFALLQRHHTMIREGLQQHEGREVDRAGDGFLTSFAAVSNAVECAIAIQRELAAFNASDAPTGIHVRIGLGAGEPVSDGQALFGSAINLTARVCSKAQPDQILAAPVVRDLCAGKSFAFENQEECMLKGFDDPIRLHEVVWH